MQETRKPNRFRVTSIIIASVMLAGAFGVLIGPFTINVSASITGNTYSGAGNWVITSATVYTGETLTVYGNIYINTSGSLTLLDTILTMDEPPSPQRNIYLNYGFLKIGTNSTLKSTNATAGHANYEINSIPYPVQVSNATVENCFFNLYRTVSYIDNSTLSGSIYYEDTNAIVNGLNASCNLWKDVNNTYGSWVISSTENGVTVTSNEFRNITQYVYHNGGLNGIVTIVGTSGFSHGARIIKNHFTTTVERYGIYATHAYGVNIRNNIFDNVSGKYPGYTGVGIQVVGTGIYGSTWADISNNTIKMVYSRTGGGVYPSRGIAIAGSNYIVRDNNIWSVVKPPPDAFGPHAIFSSASDVIITRNHIGNVSGTIDDAYGCPAGIQVSHLASPYTLSNVKVENNTVGVVQGASNAIAVWSFSDTERTTAVRVANNTIGIIRTQSGGIGIYIKGDNLTVVDNTITSLYRTGYGIGITRHIIFSTFSRNIINCLDVETSTAPNAIGLVYEGDARCGQGLIFGNNTIIRPHSLVWADYWITNIRLGIPAPIIYTQQDLVICYEESNFTVRGSASHLPMLDDNGTYVNASVASGIWTRTFSRWNYATSAFYWLNITLSGIAVIGDLDSINVASFVRWNASGTTDVTFTLSGLESGRMYRLYVDGVKDLLLTASGSGVISFTYSGPWSEHEFEIVATTITGQVSGLVNLIFIMFAVGVVVGVIAEGTRSLRKKEMQTSEQMMKMLVNMVIYIIIGLAGIGILYSTVA